MSMTKDNLAIGDDSAMESYTCQRLVNEVK